MTNEEALTRVKTGNFNNGLGFDMQLLVDAVGTIGEMFKSNRLCEVVRCKECKHAHMTYSGECKYCQLDIDKGLTEATYRSGDWFCADGERRESE